MCMHFVGAFIRVLCIDSISDLSPGFKLFKIHSLLLSIEMLYSSDVYTVAARSCLFQLLVCARKAMELNLGAII